MSMQATIRKIDHFVITTAQPEACLEFYRKLGFEARSDGARYVLLAGDFKINVHVLEHELEPYAANVQTGSADFCLEVEGDVAVLRRCLEDVGLEIFLGPVGRSGVRGVMRSLYLRDPDGNLVELCSYGHE